MHRCLGLERRPQSLVVASVLVARRFRHHDGLAGDIAWNPKTKSFPVIPAVDAATARRRKAELAQAGARQQVKFRRLTEAALSTPPLPTRRADGVTGTPTPVAVEARRLALIGSVKEAESKERALRREAAAWPLGSLVSETGAAPAAQQLAAESITGRAHAGYVAAPMQINASTASGAGSDELLFDLMMMTRDAAATSEPPPQRLETPVTAAQSTADDDVSSLDLFFEAAESTTNSNGDQTLRSERAHRPAVAVASSSRGDARWWGRLWSTPGKSPAEAAREASAELDATADDLERRLRASPSGAAYTHAIDSVIVAGCVGCVEAMDGNAPKRHTKQTLAAIAPSPCWDVEVERRVLSTLTCVAGLLLVGGCQTKSVNAAVGSAMYLAVSLNRVLSVAVRHSGATHEVTRRAMRALERLLLLDTVAAPAASSGATVDGWRMVRNETANHSDGVRYVPRSTSPTDLAREDTTPRTCLLHRLNVSQVATLISTMQSSLVSEAAALRAAETTIGRELRRQSDTEPQAAPLASSSFLGALCRRSLALSDVELNTRHRGTDENARATNHRLSLPSLLKVLHAMAATQCLWRGTRTSFRLVAEHAFARDDRNGGAAPIDSLHPNCVNRLVVSLAAVGAEVPKAELAGLKEKIRLWSARGQMSSTAAARTLEAIDRIVARRAHRTWLRKLREARQTESSAGVNSARAGSADAAPTVDELQLRVLADANAFDEVDVVEVELRRADPFVAWGVEFVDGTMRCCTLSDEAASAFAAAGVTTDRAAAPSTTRGSERAALVHLGRLVGVNGKPVATPYAARALMFGALAVRLEVIRLAPISEGDAS